MKILPLKFSRREEGSSSPGGDQGAGVMEERLVDAQPSSGPSIWNNSAFDLVAFTDRFYYVPRNIPNNYQVFYTMSSSQLSSLLEVQLVRCFMIEKELREKCVETLGRMQFLVSNLNKRTWEEGVALKQM